VRVRMGIAILPYQSVAREVRSGQLFCARITGQHLSRETGWVHMKSEHLPRAVVEMKRLFDSIRPKLRLHPAEPHKK